MRLVVGLGNPGPQYKYHRHNAGFMVADGLCARASASEWREKFTGLVSRAVIAGSEVTLLKPSTFMNLSGRSVQKAVQQLGLKLADIIVVHDDLELAYGDVRPKQGGGHGGHNGLRDITATLGPDYARVRIGIGRPAVGAVDAYVLSAFNAAESSTLDATLGTAMDVVEVILGGGIEEAIARFAPVKRKS